MGEWSDMGTLRPSALGRAGRGIKACAVAAALVAVLAGAVVASPAAGQEATGDDVAVRIVARKLESGRIEFGLQQRAADDTWGTRRLPPVRFFPTTARVGSWLASSALDLPAGEVRIVARRLEGGRVEFGLQQRRADDSWGDRQLPRVRFFPTTATVNRWLASSPLTLTIPETAGGYTAVSAGSEHSCAVRGDGAIDCWGTNRSGETVAPAGRFSAVAAGGGLVTGDHSCGLRTDGTIECWGYNFYGQAQPPAGQFRAVTARGEFTCGLRTDGTIDCWGWDADGKAIPPGGRFSAVTAALHHVCGLRTDSTVACWGWDDSGQAGPPSGRFSAVTAGGSHSCGLRTDGTVECWGYNGDGQADPPAGRFSAVTAGGSHSCGLRTDGTVECWGDNEYGQADPPTGSFTAVSAGGAHSCGIRTGGSIGCWGNNEYSQAEAPTGRSAGPRGARQQVAERQPPTPAGPIELPGSPRNVRIDYVEGHTLTVHWQPPEAGGPVDYYFINQRSPGGFFPPVHPRSVRSGHSFRSQVVLRSPGLSVAHDGRANYSFVIDYVELDPNTDRGPADDILGPGAVRVVAVNRDGLAVSDEVVVPSERSKMYHALRSLVEDMVTEHRDAVPWLEDVWRYITERDKGTDPNYDHQVSSVFAFVDDWQGPLPGYASITGACRSEFIHCLAGWGIAVAGSRDYSRGSGLAANPTVTAVAAHELGHIQTLSNRAPRNPLAVVAGHVYLGRLLRSDPSLPAIRYTSFGILCSAGELYADLAEFLVLEAVFAADPALDSVDAAQYLGYWQECTPGGSGRPSGEAIAIARSTLSGQMPQWFYDTYQNRDGSYDLESLWQDVASPTLGGARGFSLYVLKDQFGGYCPDARSRIAKFAYSGSGTGNPWRDGGCPEPTAPVGEFSAVSDTCAIRTDGTVHCWGYNPIGRADPPSGQFATISPGGGHYCGLRNEGTIDCWGYDGDGQTDAPSGRFSTVASGGDRSCGIRTNGTLECWGYLRVDRQNMPTGRFTAVAVGPWHSCLIRVDGTITCWGLDQFGNINPPSGAFSAVSVGEWHSCAIRVDDTLACWGSTSHARQGETDAPDGTFLTVSAGGSHSCGLRTDGTLECWGVNEHDQTNAPAGQFTDVSAGGTHTCAVRSDGTLACWGDNTFGQLGPQS